jgi:succinate dehydrogenase / fumarate reductase cytochrome b subunit
MNKQRPKHLDLLKIAQPIPAIISIMHRISGALLFLFIPFLLYLLQLSLVSPESFAKFKSVVGNPLGKLILLGLLWAYLHHFCAGIRYLAIDLEYGVGLAAARASSKIVLAVSLALTVILGALLW